MIMLMIMKIMEVTIIFGFFKADPARALTRTDSVFFSLSNSVVHLNVTFSWYSCLFWSLWAIIRVLKVLTIWIKSLHPKYLHRLGNASFAIYVELHERIVNCIGQAHLKSGEKIYCHGHHYDGHHHNYDPNHFNAMLPILMRLGHHYD